MSREVALAPGGGEETLAIRRRIVAAAAVALGVHLALGAVLYASASSTGGSWARPIAGASWARLCEHGRRCPFAERRIRRRLPDPGPMATLDLVEVALVPRLGRRKRRPHELPRHVQYEQPKVHPKAVNIRRDNPSPKPVRKAAKPHEAMLDRHRKRPLSLDDILDVPPDEDPRKRPTRLDDIIGTPQGSPGGTADEAAVNRAIALLERALRRRFVVPASLSDRELRKLRVKVRIEMAPDGSIRRYQILRPSPNALFNRAAEAAVQAFAPKFGGTARLPHVPDEIRDRINAGRILFVFDGRYLHR